MMIICVCNMLNERAIQVAINNGAKSVEEVCRETDTVMKCNTCLNTIETLIAYKEQNNVLAMES